MPTGTLNVRGVRTAPPTVTILFNHLFARRGVRHIEQGARVADDGTNVQRQAAGRYDASRHLVNDLLFVACRIIFAQQVQPELPKRFDRGAQSLDRAFIVLFQRDDALLRGRSAPSLGAALHDLGRIKLHHLLIDPQKRLATPRR